MQTTHNFKVILEISKYKLGHMLGKTVTSKKTPSPNPQNSEYVNYCGKRYFIDIIKVTKHLTLK